MKKLILLNVILLLFSWSINAQTATAPTGNGTIDSPYEIATLENLYWITTNKVVWDKHFIQTADIVASATSEWSTGGWLPIGDWFANDDTGNRVFSGSYDGQGHTISELYINDNLSYVAFGLFGRTQGATVKNLGIINVSIDISTGSNNSTGALVGSLFGGSLIENCFSSGNVQYLSSGNSGGLVGDSYGGSMVINSYSSCNVTGTHITGGLVGYNLNSLIKNCYYLSGTVDGSRSEYSTTGGLAGMNNNYGSISKCYSTGTVAGYEYAGGLVGSNLGNSQISDCYSRCSVSSAIESWRSGGFTGENGATITNCYGTGQVTGIRIRGFIGGLVDGGAVVNCFWDTETSGALLSEGGTGKTTEEMKLESTFTDWDFTTIWGISEGINDGYPSLKTESTCSSGTIALTSGADNQTVCASSAITFIVYTVGGGASGASISPALPDGLSGTYDAGAKTFTISGAPTIVGSYEYTVSTTGTESPCTEATASGTINVKVQPFATAPAIGNGTSGNPYQIATLENLYWIRANPSSWTKYFIQTQDIDASATSDWCTGGWLPIGIAWENAGAEIKVFSGSYDGQGHTISGLHITNSSSVAFGLFGRARGASIKNLGIINVDVSGLPGSVNGLPASAGGLVGYATGVTINNCYSTGTAAGSSRVGGLVGDHTGSSTMFNCYSTCNVSGTSLVGGLVAANGDNSTITYSHHSTGTVSGIGSASNIGGLVGRNFGATISKCFSSGTVNGYNYTGGLAGSNESSASITNCYSRSNCSSDPTYGSPSGGFVGLNYTNSNITNCYSTGSVQGVMGGFVGNQAVGSTVTNSFWDTETSGTSYSLGGIGKTTYYMKTETTFTDWDFNIIWGINADNNDGYPYFKCIGANLAISSGSNTPGVCVNAAITPIVYNVGGGASGATISPTLPNGLSGTYDSGGKTFTISGTPTAAGAYTYTITTTGTASPCTEATATGTITVNPLPEVTSINYNSPICYDTDAYFYLEGTPDAEVVYSFDGGNTTWTVPLTGGVATVLDMEARSDVTLSLISIKNISTGCIKTLNSTSKVIVISPTVSISGAHTACTSTMLTAVTNASSPTFQWATFIDEEWILAGEGPTLLVTEPGNYYLWVHDGMSSCERQSEAFAVTFIPEPEVSVSSNNSPICYDANAIFYLEGTPGAEVVYSFDAGATTWTVSLNGGTATIEDMEAQSDVTLSLISIKINSTGCIKALNETSTVTVNSPTANISGDHIACGSATLTAITNASNPTYYWATVNDEGWVLEGEGSTFEVTKSGIYYLAVLDGITGCDGLSDAFEVTINPAPEVQVTPTSANIKEPESVTLTATGTADIYTWSPATGLNTTTGATVLAKPVKNTTYTVTGSLGECITTASAVITVQELCKNSADQYEPNNTMGAATYTILENNQISANLINTKDQDWYVFNTGSDGSYSINFIAKVNVDLINSRGQKLRAAGRTTPNTYNLSGGSSYFVKVSGSGFKSYLCYTLSVSFSTSISGLMAEAIDDTKSAKIESIPDGICKIWPNPANIEFQFYNGNVSPVQMSITDVTGRQIEIIKNVGIAETVVFGINYKPGLYFVSTTENGVQKIFKLIKQ